MSKSPPVSEPLQYSTGDSERVRSQLENLLASQQFRASRRCQLLLQYVTDHALSGDVGAFKERTLGVSVFGREPTYDTNQDPVVRATAGEVRKKLAQYYQEPQHEGEIRIALKPGSYLPEFHIPDTHAPSVSLPVIQPVQPKVRQPRRKLPLSVLAVVLVAVAAWGVLKRMERSPLEQFWARASGMPSVLLCLGQPPAYNFRSDKKQTDLSAALAHPTAESLAASHELIPLDQLIPMPDRYMAFGDAMCMLRLAAFFEKRGTPYFVRGNAATSFADLREHPAVLIGAFDNEWTLRLGSQLRFSFKKDFDDPAGITEIIRDRDHPGRSKWKLTNAWPDWNVPMDYALITRVLDRETDRMLVIAAGITQYGTMAAGEFITKPEYFAEALSKFPKDWKNRNLQIVLEVPVVHGANGHPRVVATEVW